MGSVCVLPGSPGAGAAIALARVKVRARLRPFEVTAWYAFASPQRRSSPGARNEMAPPATFTIVGLPGDTASRSSTPEFALSWWKRGHDAGAHAGAFVSYAKKVPARVAAMTLWCEPLAVSSTPNEPMAGFATIQSPVNFG